MNSNNKLGGRDILEVVGGVVAGAALAVGVISYHNKYHHRLQDKQPLTAGTPGSSGSSVHYSKKLNIVKDRDNSSTSELWFPQQIVSTHLEPIWFRLMNDNLGRVYLTSQFDTSSSTSINRSSSSLSGLMNNNKHFEPGRSLVSARPRADLETKGSEADRQLWRLEKTSVPGRWLICNRASGLYLDVLSSSHNSGAAIDIAARSMKSYWCFEARPGAANRFIITSPSRLVLTADNMGRITQENRFDEAEIGSQIWELIIEDPVPPPVDQEL